MSVYAAGAEADLRAGRTANASVTVGNLGCVNLLCGEIEISVGLLRRSVELADAANDEGERVISRTNLAHALHMARQLDEAEQWFQHAEALERARSGVRFLFQGDGVEYGDLLIATGRWSDAQIRANANLTARKGHSAFECVLLAAARANLAELRQRGRGDPRAMLDQVDEALTRQRIQSQLDRLPQGLLTRAEILRLLYRPHEALEMLEESLDLALRCGMRLFEVDTRTARAQLLAELGSRAEAATNAVAAIRLARDIGYRGQDRALTELNTRLNLQD